MAKKKGSREKKASKTGGFFRGLYIVVFAFSLVIVLGYVAIRFMEPRIDAEVVFTPAPPEGGAPASSAPAPGGGSQTELSGRPAATPEPEGLVLHRRDGVRTCLLIGHADMGGTDTLMLGVFDTKGKTASLVSIPRDTVVYFDGKDRKINTVFDLGGVDDLKGQVSGMLGVPVDCYVEVNTRAFQRIVDKIGGVRFYVPVNMDYDDPYQDLHIHIKKGEQLLNGEQALGVMRCRSAYANQDLGRVQTQRKFLVALAKQTVTLSNITKVTDLVNILFTYVNTDLTLTDTIYYATQAIGMDLDADLTSATLEGEWTNPFYELDDESVLELVNGLGIYEEEVPAEVLNIRHP